MSKSRNENLTKETIDNIHKNMHKHNTDNQLDKQQAIGNNHRQQHNIGPATEMGKKSPGV
jgi:predicted DNA binding CopG/RHH family protein